MRTSLSPIPAVEPVFTNTPWRICGWSRSHWYRLWSAGLTPRPVAVPGSSRNWWRVTELRAWLASLPTVRRDVPNPHRGRPRAS